MVARRHSYTTTQPSLDKSTWCGYDLFVIFEMFAGVAQLVRAHMFSYRLFSER